MTQLSKRASRRDFLVAGLGAAAGACAMSAMRTRAASAADKPAKPKPESPPWATKDLRAGIIGTDNSHAVAFSERLPRRIRSGGSRSWRPSRAAAPTCRSAPTASRRFAETVRANGVEFVDTIEELLPKVDVVLLHSVDGRPHLAQATPVLKAGKRLFIDKPLAATVADAHGSRNCRRRRARRISVPRRCGFAATWRNCATIRAWARSSRSSSRTAGPA